jgi:hypothetical protein
MNAAISTWAGMNPRPYMHLAAALSGFFAFLFYFLK